MLVIINFNKSHYRTYITAAYRFMSINVAKRSYQPGVRRKVKKGICILFCSIFKNDFSTSSIPFRVVHARKEKKEKKKKETETPTCTFLCLTIEVCGVLWYIIALENQVYTFCFFFLSLFVFASHVVQFCTYYRKFKHKVRRYFLLYFFIPLKY